MFGGGCAESGARPRLVCRITPVALITRTKRWRECGFHFGERRAASIVGESELTPLLRGTGSVFMLRAQIGEDFSC